MRIREGPSAGGRMGIVWVRYKIWSSRNVSLTNIRCKHIFGNWDFVSYTVYLQVVSLHSTIHTKHIMDDLHTRPTQSMKSTSHMASLIPVRLSLPVPNPKDESRLLGKITGKALA